MEDTKKTKEKERLAEAVSPEPQESLSLSYLKQNFDNKMDKVATGLENIAAGVSNLPSSTFNVAFQPNSTPQTSDQALWVAIKNRTEAVGFNRYLEFINRVLCEGPKDSRSSPGGDAKEFEAREGRLKNKLNERFLDLPNPLHGVDAYNLLKVATEVFLLLECGVVINPAREPKTGEPMVLKDPKTNQPILDSTGNPIPVVPGLEESRLGQTITLRDIRLKLTQYLGPRGLPYLDRIVRNLFPNMELDEVLTDSPYCYGILKSRFSCPCMIEFIWSYWHEEGMLVQGINAISLRFQNRRLALGRDPLAHLETDPLRGLNNLLWGYIQDEQHRLTVKRRTYEYDHHYGLTLYGKAVPKIQPADSRSKFLEAFHNLLHISWVFFKEQADTQVIPDGFPLLNALKEVHLLLAEGAHNQFGDLPWTARVEMLIQQWLLARTEMREFLRGRAMVPYPEAWMSQVDVMKTLQGWTDVTVRHFRDLAVFGEQLLLTIRYGDWSEVIDENQAKNWATSWRPEIQGYIHAYRAVTGVDLASEPVNYTLPSVLLRERAGKAGMETMKNSKQNRR